MAKDYRSCLNSVASMFKFESEKPTLKPNEKNALKILEVRCHQKMGDSQKALTIMTESQSIVVDKIAYNEIIGELQLSLKLHEDSIETFERLLEYNAANFETYYYLI